MASSAGASKNTTNLFNFIFVFYHIIINNEIRALAEDRQRLQGGLTSGISFFRSFPAARAWQLLKLIPISRKMS